MSKFKVIIQTVVISLTFFVILFIISSENFFINQIGFKIESIHVFIALIPLVIWLIVSGKLKEIKGPGGIGLSMRYEVQKPITPELTDSPLKIDRAIVRAKGGVDELQSRIIQDRPTTLSFVISRKDYYGQWEIGEYIRELGIHPEFRFILFTDTKGKFKGCMKVSDYEKLLDTGEVVEMIESGRIMNDPRVIKNSMQKISTNKQALNEMDKLNTNWLPVVDDKNKFIGVVTQEEIVRNIIAKVIREA